MNLISIILPKNIFLHKKKQQDWLVFLIWFWSVKLFRNESKLAKWSQTWFGKTSYNFSNILCAKKWITLLFRENIPLTVRIDLKPTIFSYFYPIPGLLLGEPIKKNQQFDEKCIHLTCFFKKYLGWNKMLENKVKAWSSATYYKIQNIWFG